MSLLPSPCQLGSTLRSRLAVLWDQRSLLSDVQGVDPLLEVLLGQLGELAVLLLGEDLGECGEVGHTFLSVFRRVLQLRIEHRDRAIANPYMSLGAPLLAQ